MSKPSRILLVTTDRIAAEMAGPAIRAWELARLLVGDGHDVVVASPYAVERTEPGIRAAVAADRAELEPLARAAEVVIGIAGCIHHHPWLAELDGTCIVADAYDPTALEALERHRPRPGAAGDDGDARGDDQAEASYADALAQMVEPLRWADLVLCASERQRDLLTGLLLALGRINPATYAADPTLDDLVAVVPFGLPSEAPEAPAESPLRGAEGSGTPARPDDLVALWGGGIYDWLDPLTLIEAVARTEEIGGRRLVAVFPGTVHPTPAVGAMAMVDVARGLADRHGLLGDRVFFGDGWVPYHERAGWLLGADVGVSLHGRHLETVYAFRTRMLDYLWTALPILCTDGDALADLVRARGLGRVVPPGDPDAVVEALRSMSDPDERTAQRAALGATAAGYTWAEVAEPLRRWCRTPRRAADRHPGTTRGAPAWVEVALRAAGPPTPLPSSPTGGSLALARRVAGRAKRALGSVGQTEGPADGRSVGR
jgi:glycosyltransferase involved in cell wall biosynthesis